MCWVKGGRGGGGEGYEDYLSAVDSGVEQAETQVFAPGTGGLDLQQVVRLR